MAESDASRELERISAPVRWARWLRRVTLVLAIAAGVLFFSRYGSERAPADSGLASVPPGALCIVDRWTSGVMPGQNVFVLVPGRGTTVDTVTAVDGDTVTLGAAGPLPRRQLRSTILVVFDHGH